MASASSISFSETPGRGTPQAEPGGLQGDSPSPGTGGHGSAREQDASSADGTLQPEGQSSRDAPKPKNGPTTRHGHQTGTNDIVSSFSAVGFVNSRKTSLVQLFYIFTKLSIKHETTLYFDPPRPRHMKGIFCKNLFLKDRRGQFYLVILNEGKDVDLKKFRTSVHAHRNLSFGSASDLDVTLALTPGAVSPFGLINDTDNSVRFIVDQSLFDEAQFSNALLNFHPFVDFLTTLITFNALVKFVHFSGHEIELVDL